MPWGTDDGGHYYISPVEQAAIRNDNEERRAERSRQMRSKTQVAEYVYVKDPDDGIKDEFCRLACEIERCKALQRAYVTGSRAYNDALKQVNQNVAKYNVILRQLQALYDRTASSTDTNTTSVKTTITRQEKAEIRNSVSADVFYKFLNEFAPGRKDDVVQMVDDAIAKILQERGLLDG